MITQETRKIFILYYKSRCLKNLASLLCQTYFSERNKIFHEIIKIPISNLRNNNCFPCMIITLNLITLENYFLLIKHYAHVIR
jgi:hypothetical protein